MLVAVWWLQHQDEAGFTVKRDIRRIDYYMKDFVATEMGPDGAPVRRIEAAALTHYTDDGGSEMVGPKVWLFRPDGEVWYLEAESASDSDRKLLLKGKVLMNREGVPERALVVETQDLWIHPDNEYAESAETVTIKTPFGVTRAKGVRVDLKAGRVQLLAAVQGEYATGRQ